MNLRQLAAEAIGTFILVGVGSMSIVSAGLAGAPVLVVVPFGFGLGLVAALNVAGRISGGHFNPAVTLGAFLDRRIDAVNAIGYVVAQIIGAVAASAFVLALSSQDAVRGTRNAPGAKVTDLQAFAAEVILTAIFIAAILTVTKREPGRAMIVIPLTLVAIHFAGIPISGASVNPARALGPALVGGDLGSIWIYLTAPLIGAVVGWGVFRVLDSAD
jgi:aquaporin Z